MPIVQVIRGYKIIEVASGVFLIEDPWEQTLPEKYPTFQDAKREVVRRL